MALYAIIDGEEIIQGVFLPDAANGVRFLGDSNTYIYHPAPDTIAIVTGGTERVRVDSAGYVRVGIPPVGDCTLFVKAGSDGWDGGIALQSNNNTHIYRWHPDNSGPLLLAYGANTQLMSITTTGAVLINATAAYADNGQLLEVNKSADDGGIGLFCWSTTDAERALIEFHKSSSAAIGTKALVADDEAAGAIIWKVADGAVNWSPIASIAAFVDAAPGAGDTAGRLVFSTTADGAFAVTPALTIDSAQNLVMNVLGATFYMPRNDGTPRSILSHVAGDDSFWLGSVFENAYLGGQTIYFYGWNGSASAEKGRLDTNSDFTLTRSTGQSTAIRTLTELTVIEAAASTPTVIQIPADAIVVGVSVRVTTVIPTAATFDVGVGGATNRYGAGLSTAAGTTNPGTDDGARWYAAAVSIVITPNIQPVDNTGRVRVTIHYLQVTPPTS